MVKCSLKHQIRNPITRYYLQRLLTPRGLLLVSLVIFSSTVSSLSFHPASPEAELKLKILNLQKFSKPETRNKRNSKHLASPQTAQSARDLSFLELFGSKLTEDEVDVEKELDENDKQLQRKAKVMKIRKKARFPRRSYGGYEMASKSSPPAVSYKAPSPKVSTHRPTMKGKNKSKPFTSFRSIASSKSSKPVPAYSMTTPSYSAPEPSRQSYSVSSPSPPSSRYSKPTTTTYSKPPPSTYSKPSQSYSKPSQSYSKPSQSYSKPSQSYSKPSQSYSKPSQGYSKPSSQSYSPVTPESGPASEYSYSYQVPETETQAWEERTGHSTTGSYSVLLPDGRTMTVSYSVPDTETGFVAEVSYQGEARHPDNSKEKRERTSSSERSSS